VENSGIAFGSIHAEFGIRSQFGGQSTGSAYAGTTAPGAIANPQAATIAANTIRIAYHP
jgi:hypothetical protein